MGTKECAYGLNQLCRLMSAPTREAWTAAIHMMAYLRINKDKGIKFHSKGNENPVVFSDAAFNPDPADGLSQYGCCAMWMGGPLAHRTKRGTKPPSAVPRAKAQEGEPEHYSGGVASLNVHIGYSHVLVAEATHGYVSVPRGINHAGELNPG